MRRAHIVVGSSVLVTFAGLAVAATLVQPGTGGGQVQFSISLDATSDNITVAGEKNPILGRAMIVHAKEDDGGQPTGNAGGRIAQGVIGVAKDPAAK